MAWLISESTILSDLHKCFDVDRSIDRRHPTLVLNFSIHFMLLRGEKIRSTSEAHGLTMIKGNGEKAYCEIDICALDQ